MKSSLFRSLTKATIWETTTFTLQTLLMWWYFSSIVESIQLNVIITGVKVVLLFMYLRLWKRIKWGKN